MDRKYIFIALIITLALASFIVLILHAPSGAMPSWVWSLTPPDRDISPMEELSYFAMSGFVAGLNPYWSLRPSCWEGCYLYITGTGWHSTPGITS